MKCKYYAQTYYGRRCIFLSLEEWKKMREFLEEKFCKKNSEACIIKRKVDEKIRMMKRMGGSL